MGIEDLRRWHWAVIGGLLGLLYAYMLNSMEPPRHARSTSAAVFEKALLQPPPGDGQPYVRDVVVEPPLEGKYTVNFKSRQPTRDRKDFTYVEYVCVAETPYKPWRVVREQPRGDETIVTHLRELAKKHPHVKFTYAFWRERRMTYAMWISAGVVAIGGVWPTLLNLLTGAGLGRRREEKVEPEYDLSRFGKEPPKPAPVPALNDEDAARLRAIEEELERNLSGSAPAAREDEEDDDVPVIRPLSNQPLAAPQAPPQPQETKEYDGEFYPTVAHAPKKKQES